MTFQRPSGSYESTSTTVNKNKYREDSQNGIKISSQKVDGDMNYMIDALNQLETGQSALVSGSLPGQAGNAGLPLITNGSTTSFGQLNGAQAIQDGTIPSSAFAGGSVDVNALANLAVTTNKIQNEAVTLDKLADGTAGSILGFDASGEAAAFAPGSSGQFLSFVGGTPSWVDSPFAPGFVMMWPTVAAPTGWFLCHGQALSKTTYSILYSVIGGIYGETSTTFNLPDYRGMFLRGFDPSATIDVDSASRTDRGDGTTGNDIGTRQEDAISDQEATVKVVGSDTVSGGGDTAIGITNGSSKDVQVLTGRTAADHTNFDVKINGTGAETRPINKTVNFIIKA